MNRLQADSVAAGPDLGAVAVEEEAATGSAVV